MLHNIFYLFQIHVCVCVCVCVCTCVCVCVCVCVCERERERERERESVCDVRYHLWRRLGGRGAGGAHDRREGLAPSPNAGVHRLDVVI